MRAYPTCTRRDAGGTSRSGAAAGHRPHPRPPGVGRSAPARVARRLAAGLALLIAGACEGQLPLVVDDPTEVVQRVTVADRSHSAFPHVLRLRNGEVLVSWREGAGHSYRPARAMLARYRDAPGGLEHLETRVMLDHPGEDEREAGLTELRDGTVLANLFTGYYLQDAAGHITRFWYPLVLRSGDGGRTWTDTVRIPATEIRNASGRAFEWLALRAPVVELASGDLLMPVYGVLQGDTRHSNHVLRSADGGRTWNYGAQIARDARQDEDYNETSLLVSGSRVVAVFRSEDGFLRQSESMDGGAHWLPVRKLDLWGVPPHLFRLRDGRVLLTHGYRKGRMGVRYTLSRDDARMWDPAVEGVLYDEASTTDCGYPSTVQLGDGSLLTVYYGSREVGGEHQMQVHAVRYRLTERPAR